MNIQHTNIEVGKYLVSPLTMQLEKGCFRASVSIRSGRGSNTHDRVLRFSKLFDNAASALSYATDEGLSWIRERGATAVCVS